jgi:NifU-like protein involved in Fe-S cluster formation
MKLRSVEEGVIVDAKFKTSAAAARCQLSLATEWLKGKTVGDALKIKNGHYQ